MELSTTTPLWCDNQATSTCYYPSENLLYFWDSSNTITFILLGSIVFFLVAIFVKKLFEKI